MFSKIEHDFLTGNQQTSVFAYSFDCTFFRLICLTAKALHRMTMCGFLVYENEPEKRTLKRVQQKAPGYT